MPRITRIVATHDVPMFLHEQRVRARRVQCDAMHAMTDFCIWVRNVLRMQPAINWFPRFAAVVRAKRAGS